MISVGVHADRKPDPQNLNVIASSKRNNTISRDHLTRPVESFRTKNIHTPRSNRKQTAFAHTN